MKSAFACYLILLCCYLAAQDEIHLLPETPFFKSPALDSPIIGTCVKPVTVPVVERRPVYITDIPVLKNNKYPLMVYTTFFRVRLQNIEAWVSKDLQFDPEQQLVVPRPIPHPMYKYLVAFTLPLLLIVLYYLCSQAKSLLYGAGVANAKTICWGLLFLLLLRLLLVFTVRFFAGKVIFSPGDEYQYFQVSRDILNFEVTTPWFYTIGLPLLYLPYILLFDAKNYLDIESAVTFVHGFILSPLSIGLVFFIVQKLAQSSTKAFWTALLLVVLPFVYLPVEIFSQPPVFKAIFCKPLVFPLSYHLFYIYLGAGLYGMSDVPSNFVILLCIFLALSIPYRTRWLVIISILYSFACLIRLANIFLAPLILYILWQRTKQQPISARHYLKMIMAIVLPFIIVYSPQLLINKLQLGSWWTFPYVLHNNRSGEGFVWEMLRMAPIFLINTNYLYMTLGAIGLIFQKSRYLRAVFGLWTLPLLLFFCGFPGIENHPLRLILTTYGGLLAAFICSTAWETCSERYKYFMIVMIVSNVVLIAPCCRFSPPYPFFSDQYAWGHLTNVIVNITLPICSAIALWYCSHQRQLCIFGVLFLLVFYSGYAYLIVAIFLMLLLQLAIQALRIR